MIYVLLFARCVLAVTFVSSVIGKVRSRERYTAFVTACGELAPVLPSRLCAPTVVAAECAVLAGLALPASEIAAFVVAAALLTGFTVAIALVLYRRRQVKCHCFGASSAPLGTRHVVRNGALLLVTAAGAWAAANVSIVELLPVTAMSTAVAGVACGLVVAFLDELVELFLPLQH
jgi:hypothetical protein